MSSRQEPLSSRSRGVGEDLRRCAARIEKLPGGRHELIARSVCVAGEAPTPPTHKGDARE